jgi:hypothetical protein
MIKVTSTAGNDAATPLGSDSRYDVTGDVAALKPRLMSATPAGVDQRGLRLQPKYGMTTDTKEVIRVIREIRGPFLLIPNLEMRAAWQQNDR